MIAYADAFRLMFWATLVVVPLLVLIRQRRHSTHDDDSPHVAIE